MATQGDERPDARARVRRRARAGVRGVVAALAVGALAAPALTACEPILPATNVIANGSNVVEGTTVWSANGLYRLVMQSDGNLVVRTKAGTALWTSRTSAYPHSTLVLGSDGVLRIKSPAGREQVLVYDSYEGGMAFRPEFFRPPQNITVRERK